MKIPLIIQKLCYLPWRLSEWIVNNCIAPALIRGKGVQVGQNLRVNGMPRVSIEPGTSIVLGNNVTLCSRPTSNILYLARPCVLVTLGSVSSIRIGDDVGLSGVTLVAMQGITIGDRTLIGAETMIVDTDFHPLDADKRRVHPTDGAKSRPVIIGKDVFIGARVIILKGVTVGDRAVVGAGAVVSRDVQPGEIVAGNPAKVVACASRAD